MGVKVLLVFKFSHLSKYILHLDAVNYVLVSVIIEQSRWVAYIDCCLDFVTRQDPKFDAGLPYVNYCIRNTVLESVFDSGRTDYLKIYL